MVSCNDQSIFTLQKGVFEQYDSLNGAFDEYFDGNGSPHPFMKEVIDFFNTFSLKDFLSFHDRSQEIFSSRSVSFNVYSDKQGMEKIFPFDLLPRVIAKTEWDEVEKGLEQRITALNLFLNDIYGKQLIVKNHPHLSKVLFTSKNYYPKLHGITPPNGIFAHVAGVDLIKNKKNRFKVLEDNLRVPSGVSYILESRNVMKRIFPKIFNLLKVESVNVYPFLLREALQSIAPTHHPMMVLLTPGPYNSAYFEHVYLARRMDCPLVQNCDLVVENKKVYLKTLKGLKQVHIIYRRTNDDFIDPKFFRPESLLGIPGLVDAYLAGNVLLANALGNGIADDKGIYPLVPSIIRYYLAEEPLLEQVETYSAIDDKERSFILSNLSKLVIKPVDESGGKGILFGPKASKKELENMKELIEKYPRNFIAQPLEGLSACPTITEGAISPRRVDLRPFIVTGKNTWVMPGGLTRTAINRESYVVNSSQGGGTKDTWIVR